MIPSEIELSLARQSGFDFYTLTNLGFMDLAFNMKFIPNLFAVVKSSLTERQEGKLDLEGLEMQVGQSPASLHLGSFKEMTGC